MRRHRLVLASCASSLLIASAASAQTAPAPAGERVPVSVGDASLRAAELQPFSGNWRVVEIAPDGTRTEIDRSADRLEAGVHEGRPVWRQLQHETSGNTGISHVTVIADRATFAPLTAEWRDVRDGSLRRLTYRDGSLHIECGGHLCPPNMTAPAAGAVTERDQPLTGPGFDYWGGSYGLLFALLPLAPGSRFTVPVVHPVQGLFPLQVDVGALEQVDAGGGNMVAAYRVTTPQTGWVYHVSDRPPYWLRLEYVKRDGTRQITERI